MIFLLLHTIIMFSFSILWLLSDAPKHPYYKLAEIRIFFIVSLLSFFLYLCMVFDSTLREIEILWFFFVIHGVYMVTTIYILSAYYTQALANPVTLSIGVIIVWISLLVLLLINTKLIIVGLTSKIIIATFSFTLSVVILFRLLQLGSRLSIYAISLKLLYLFIFSFYFVIWVSICFNSSIMHTTTTGSNIHHYHVHPSGNQEITSSDETTIEKINSSDSSSNTDDDNDNDIIKTSTISESKSRREFSHDKESNNGEFIKRRHAHEDKLDKTTKERNGEIKNFTSVVIVIFQIVDVSFIILYGLVVLKT